MEEPTDKGAAPLDPGVIPPWAGANYAISQLILTHSLVGVMFFDPQGTLVQCNQRFADIIGAPREQLLGFNMLAHIPAGPARQALQDALDHGESLFEGQYHTVNGGRTVHLQTHHRRLEDPQGNTLGGVSIFHDLTERVQAQQAWRDSELRLRHLLDSAPVGILVVDVLGNIIDLNETIVHILGSPSAAATRTINIFTFPPLQQAGISQDLQRCVLDGQPLTAEHAYTTKWGKTIHLRYHLSALRNAHGEIWGVQAAVEDFTAAWETEQARKELEQQLHHSLKLEAVGRLAGGIAHDFNNLLTGIIGYAQVVLDDLPTEHISRADMQEILDGAQRAAQLTQQLLGFSRRQLIKPRVLQLNEVIDASQRMLVRIIGEDVVLAFTPGTHLWPVFADPGQIDQVLVNLAVNARDAMPRGGHLSIQTHNRVVPPEVMLPEPDALPGDYVVLTVVDEGHGMDPDTLAHLFEPFFTTKEQGKGTGLGLATVYGIAKQNGGFIKVESEPGVGTTFEVFFPRANV